MSQDEFTKNYLTAKTPKNVVSGASDASLLPKAPASVNWRAAQKVTSVKNQSGCGSGWAFATIASLESLSLIRDNKFVSLSEQQVIDCCQGGCSGGAIVYALECSKTSGNILSVNYPYVAKEQSSLMCPKLKSSMVSFGTGVITNGNLDELSRAVAIQPVVAMVDASKWSSYKSGIMTETSTSTNHAVLFVGYTPIILAD